MSEYQCWLCHDAGWLCSVAANQNQVAIFTRSQEVGGKCEPPSVSDIEQARRAGIFVRRCHECSGGEPALYSIEPHHLKRLKEIAGSLERMNELGLAGAVVDIMAIVRYAEALEALRKPGQIYVHMTPKERP